VLLNSQERKLNVSQIGWIKTNSKAWIQREINLHKLRKKTINAFVGTKMVHEQAILLKWQKLINVLGREFWF
jgi:hypothetical protein